MNEFVLAMVGEEMEYMSWNDALELAIERDNQAANELEVQFNG